MDRAEQTVFIIDDDGAVRASLSKNLIKRGFLVETFESAAAFLEVFDPSQMGCIILDYGMPEVNGLELQKRLVEEGRLIPIIFITGHGGVSESVQAIKAGAIDFLEKPFRTEVLVEHLKAAFEKNREDEAVIGESQRARSLLDRLTPREAEIVELIVANPSLSTSKEIGRAIDTSPRTVDHHGARILEKLKIKSIVELADISRSAKKLDQSSST